MRTSRFKQGCAAGGQGFLALAPLEATFQNQILHQQWCLSWPNNPDKRVEILGHDLTAAYRCHGSNSCSERLVTSNDLRMERRSGTPGQPHIRVVGDRRPGLKSRSADVAAGPSANVR